MESSIEKDKKLRGKMAMASCSATEVSQEAAEFIHVGVHPLLIEIILNQVFQHLIGPIAGHSCCMEAVKISNDIKSVRLVCTKWNEAATRVYRRARSPLSFSLQKCDQPVKPCFDLKMEKFLNTMKDSNLIPVQRYSIREAFFMKQNQGLMKDFMRICGPGAVELGFYFDDRSAMDFTRRSFKDLNLDKLQKLTFYGESYQGKSISSKLHYIAILMEVLLTAARNLKHFEVDILSDEKKWKMFTKRLGETIFKRIPNTVTKLCLLDVPISDIELNNLAESDLILEELHIDFELVKRREVIWRLLSRQAATLKVLKILNISPIASTSLKFPRLKKLLNLEILGHISPIMRPDIFPKLISLNVDELVNETAWSNLLLSCSKNGASLKKICLPYKFPQAALVKKVCQSFPYINQLHMSSSARDFAETLREIYVYFPNIEELRIYFPYIGHFVNMDSIFSGVSEEDCGRILANGNFDHVNWAEMQQRRSSITNLTKLKKLTLDNYGGDVIITDFSAHFVFMKMNALTELHTCWYQMSNRYVKRLKDILTPSLLDLGYEIDSDDEWSDLD